MTREELADKILASESKNFMFELATGMGKTYLALRKLMQWYNNNTKILIVVPRNVLIKSWKDEINKWKYTKLLNNITFVTYVSLPKMVGHYDVVIFDEGHHTSERCQQALKYFTIDHVLVLSATLNKNIKWFFKCYCKRQIEEITVDVNEAISDDVLPEPKIILLPLRLDNVTRSFVAQKFKQQYSCTQLGYYNITTTVIDWYRAKSNNPRMKRIWLSLAGARLKWLAEQKEAVIKQILKKFSNHRVLTFCGSIEQSNNLGTYCVNSKIGTKNLELFNTKKIKHIAAVGMLDEGANLTSCRVGLFQMINSSTRLTVQRIGRILRHKRPVLIFPYFINTRENEIINAIISAYDKNLITVIENVKDIKL